MMSAVSASSSARPWGTLRCVERCCPRTRQARRSETWSFRLACSMQRRRRAGLETVSRSVRPQASPRRISFSSVRSETAFRSRSLAIGLEPMAPQWLDPSNSFSRFTRSAFKPPNSLRQRESGERRHADRSHRLADRGLATPTRPPGPELGHDLLRPVLLLGHPSVLHQARKPTSDRTTFQRAGHSRPRYGGSAPRACAPPAGAGTSTRCSRR